MFDQELTPIQARVLGCLIEKEKTTPEQYPLTINALKNACNQKSARWPVTSYNEGEIGHAVRELEALGLVKLAWSTRAARYEHRFGKVYEIREKDVAVLAVLMLRGPQTAAEIRSNSQRLFEFQDVDDVEFVLQRLAERERPLVMPVPRQPGQKGQRYAHLLAGEPDLSAMPSAAHHDAASSGLEQRVADLEAEVATLKERIDALGG